MINSTRSKVIYVISDRIPIQSGYMITFPYFDESNIKAIITDGKTEMTVDPSNYTVVTVGTVPYLRFLPGYTFPEEVTKIVISREMEIFQETDLENGEIIDAEQIELVFDMIVAICQQLDEKLSRTLMTTSTESSPIILPESDKRAGHLLGFDENGNILPVLTSDIEQKLNEALAAEENTLNYCEVTHGYTLDAMNYRDQTKAVRDSAENFYRMAELASTKCSLLYSKARELHSFVLAVRNDISAIKAAVFEYEESTRAYRDQTEASASSASSDKAQVSSMKEEVLAAKEKTLDYCEVTHGYTLDAMNYRDQTKAVRDSAENFYSMAELASAKCSLLYSKARELHSLILAVRNEISAIEASVSASEENARAYRDQAVASSSSAASDRTQVSSMKAEVLQAKGDAAQSAAKSADEKNQTEALRKQSEASLEEMKSLRDQISALSSSAAPESVVIRDGVAYKVSVYTKGKNVYRKYEKVATA